MVEVLTGCRWETWDLHVSVLDRPVQAAVDFLQPDPLDNSATSRSSHLNQSLLLPVPVTAFIVRRPQELKALVPDILN